MLRTLARRAFALGKARSGKNRSLLDLSSAAVGAPNRLIWTFAAANVSRSNEARRRTSVSTNESRSLSSSVRFTQPYRSAISASKSSPLSTISSARERPTTRGSHSSAPPPGTSPTPISGWPNIALCRLAKRMSQASTNSFPMPRVRPRILAMLTIGAEERRSTKSRHKPSVSGRSAVLATSRWAIKKSGFADWNTTTFTDGSASSSVMSARNSTIVVGRNMLIGGLLKVMVHRPGWVRSVLNCEVSGMAHLLVGCEEPGRPTHRVLCHEWGISLRPWQHAGLRRHRLKRFAQRSEARANLVRKKRRLFPSGKVPALGKLVEVNELGKGSLCEATRHRIEFVGEYGYRHWDGDALRIEVPAFAPILPIETCARNERVRQPGDGDVVENVVAREAFRCSVEDTRNQLVAARVVIQEIGRKTDRGVRDSVERLRTQPHLITVGDSLLIFMLQPLIGVLLFIRKTRWRRLP